MEEGYDSIIDMGVQSIADLTSEVRKVLDEATLAGVDFAAVDVVGVLARLRVEFEKRSASEQETRQVLRHAAEQSRQSAVIEERNRIALEIHDTLAQSFTGILIQIGVARRIFKYRPDDAWELVERVDALARQGLKEARRSVWALQPGGLEFSDLAAALPAAVDVLVLDTNLNAKVKLHGTARQIPADVGLNLLRIAQEAVHNSLAHAEAQHVTVDLTFDSSEVGLCIQDDGKGFDLSRVEDGGGFGLIGMRKRCDRIGGRLSIESHLGRGTEIRVTAPTSAEHDEGIR